MNDVEEKKYWITIKNTAWIIILVVSFFVFFPAFITFLVIWAVGKVKLIE